MESVSAAAADAYRSARTAPVEYGRGGVGRRDVSIGYTQCDRCVAKVYFWTLLATVNDSPVIVLLGYPNSGRGRGARWAPDPDAQHAWPLHGRHEIAS